MTMIRSTFLHGGRVSQTNMHTSRTSLGHMLPRSENPLEYVGHAREMLGNATLDSDFVHRSTELALLDGRPLITCDPLVLQFAGLGNVHFALAGIIALATRYDLLPVLPCGSDRLLNVTPLKNFHCVNVSAIAWGVVGTVMVSRSKVCSTSTRSKPSSRIEPMAGLTSKLPGTFNFRMGSAMHKTQYAGRFNPMSVYRSVFKGTLTRLC